MTKIASTRPVVTVSDLNIDVLNVFSNVSQQSTGLFAHLLTVIPAALPSMPVSDLHADVLNALCSLTLAEAQECYVRKAVNGMMSLCANPEM
jgi:hypothetical protein